MAQHSGDGDRLHRVVQRLIPQTERVEALKIATIRASLETRHAILAQTGAKRDATLAEIARTQTAFWQVAASAIPRIEQGRTDAVVALLENRIVPARNAFLATIDHQEDWQQLLLATATGESLSIGRFTEAMVLAVAVATAALGR